MEMRGPQDGMREIYDAPRDGTEINLGHVNGLWSIGHWSRKLRRWVYRDGEKRGMPLKWLPVSKSPTS